MDIELIHEQIRNQIIELLEANKETFNAPYGIIVSKGMLKTVTFGIENRLDAKITIWTTRGIEIEGKGRYRWNIEGKYKSVKSVLEKLRKLIETAGKK